MIDVAGFRHPVRLAGLPATVPATTPMGGGPAAGRRRGGARQGRHARVRPRGHEPAEPQSPRRHPHPRRIERRIGGVRGHRAWAWRRSAPTPGPRSGCRPRVAAWSASNPPTGECRPTASSRCRGRWTTSRRWRQHRGRRRRRCSTSSSAAASAIWWRRRSDHGRGARRCAGGDARRLPTPRWSRRRRGRPRPRWSASRCMVVDGVKRPRRRSTSRSPRRQAWSSAGAKRRPHTAARPRPLPLLGRGRRATRRSPTTRQRRSTTSTRSGAGPVWPTSCIACFADHDVLAMPTVPVVAPPVDDFAAYLMVLARNADPVELRRLPRDQRARRHRRRPPGRDAARGPAGRRNHVGARRPGLRSQPPRHLVPRTARTKRVRRRG